MTVGAEMTLPSSTIANCFCWLVRGWSVGDLLVTVANVLRASLLNAG